MSISSGSSGPVDKTQTPNGVKTRRLVVFLYGAGHPSTSTSHTRVLTINRESYSTVVSNYPVANLRLTVTNLYNAAQIRRTFKGYTSDCHVTFKAVGGNFFIGNFASDKRDPGIPLDPEVLSHRENYHVDWVELEFKDLGGTFLPTLK
jgi:hypothetical protein